MSTTCTFFSVTDRICRTDQTLCDDRTPDGRLARPDQHILAIHGEPQGTVQWHEHALRVGMVVQGRDGVLLVDHDHGVPALGSCAPVIADEVDALLPLLWDGNDWRLAALRDATSKQNNVYWANQIEVQRREVSAWIAEKVGNKSDAVSKMRSAVELEESMDKNAVTPGPVTPAREMLAELFLLENHPQESLAEYEAVLKVAPNRFNAVYGAAQAAEASGNGAVAKRYLQKLSEISPGEERSKLPTKIASSSR